MSCKTKCPTKKECQDIPLDSFKNINLEKKDFKKKIEQEKHQQLILYKVRKSRKAFTDLTYL